MIITKTPLRVSFFSGGSDMPEFFEKERGAALSVTIDKYIYVMVHKTPHLGIKIMYDTIEEFPDVEQMQHAITRESLKHFGIDKEVTIASVADILAKGSGLGSSSAFTVGLVNALASPDRHISMMTREYLAQKAYFIERDMCKYPVGKQDQYAAAYGGMNIFTFEKDGNVETRPLTYNEASWNDLESRLLLVYSGRGRNANSILQKQSAAMSDADKFNLVKAGRDKAFVAARLLKESRLDDFGALLHDAWMDKKAVEKSITNEYFDGIYTRAIEAGALGGKLLGAGGGGFFLFYTPENVRSKVISTILDGTNCKVYDFKFVERGSSVAAHC